MEDKRLSAKAKAQAEQFQNADGFVDSIKFLADNPSYLGTEAAAQLPQFLQLVPGTTIGTIGAQAVGAASQNAQQVEDELRRRGVPEAEIQDRVADAFARSGALNAALPMLPGGSSVERLLAGKAEQIAGGAATRFAKPLIGETVTEGLQEGADQMVQNLAQDDPLMQGVGQATALGATLGLGTGAAAGGVDTARGDANVAVRRANALTGQLERDANRIRTPESDAVDAGREAARAIFAEAGDAVRPDPGAFTPPPPFAEPIQPAPIPEPESGISTPERNPPEIVPRNAPESVVEPLDRQALLADLESAPEPELIRNGTRVFYPGDVAAMRAKLADAGLNEGMRKTNEDGSDAGLYFPAKMQAEVDAVLRGKPSEPSVNQAEPAVKEAPESAITEPANPEVMRSQRVAEEAPEQLRRPPQEPVSTAGLEVNESADLTSEEMAAFQRQVDSRQKQAETPTNDTNSRTSPSNADASRDGVRRTMEDQGGRSGQPVPVQDGAFAPDASLDASNKPSKFPRWFRQSKLKNPKGVPLEFNHTTNADFDTFDSSRRGSNTGYAPSGLGNWFSQAVEGYGSKKLTGNIRMENPKVMPLHKLPDLDTQEDFAAYADKLRKQGFDGIYFPDVKQAVTFDSVQFKENDNTEYSESPNIFKSQRKIDPQTETPAFKKFFEGSKVVDADGAPLRVYHGSSAKFDVFDI
jgi:hypothetical protein